VGVKFAVVLCAAQLAHAAESATAANDKAESESEEAEPGEGNADPSAVGVPIELASKAQKEVARKQLQLGIDLLDAGKFAQALEVLRMSHQRVASPNTRLMIARALSKLERNPEAYAELQLALSEARMLARGASKYEDTVEAAEAELATVRGKVALVQLDLGMHVSMQGKPLEAERWSQPLVLPAGKTEFEFRLANGQTRKQSLELSAGQEVKVPLLLETTPSDVSPPPVAHEPSTINKQPIASDGVSRKTLAWASVGIAGVGLLGFATFGFLNKSRFEELEDQCTDTSCPVALREEAETGRTYQSLANVGLGVGAVGLLSATYFFLTASDARPKLEQGRATRTAKQRPSMFQVSKSKFDANAPYIVVGTHSVTLTGRF
jgi:hypothetical protein